MVIRYIFNIYVRIISVLYLPVILAKLLSRNTGKEYGVGLAAKIALVVKMIRNNRRIVSASHYLEHLAMATTILNIPKSVEGCLIECGCYKGGSSANLSLVAELCQRRLEVFDSFQGLPAPADFDKAHRLVDQHQIHTYLAGAWHGALAEVKRNIAKYGEINTVNFNVGYFQDTLPHFNQPCAFVFLDVDLVGSLETCLRYLWPLLQDGCYLFTHEAPHYEVASLFFDREWWHAHLSCEPPGLVGAGNGLGLIVSDSGFRSDVGFTIKNPLTLGFTESPQTGLEESDSMCQVG